MFYIVEFDLVWVNIGPWGSISAGCQVFYPVAFFLKADKLKILDFWPYRGWIQTMKSHWPPLKKSHRVKNLAPGGNRPPRTYINQNWTKLDYVKHFQVKPKIIIIPPDYIQYDPELYLHSNFIEFMLKIWRSDGLPMSGAGESGRLA